MLMLPVLACSGSHSHSPCIWLVKNWIAEKPHASGICGPAVHRHWTLTGSKFIMLVMACFQRSRSSAGGRSCKWMCHSSGSSMYRAKLTDLSHSNTPLSKLERLYRYSGLTRVPFSGSVCWWFLASFFLGGQEVKCTKVLIHYNSDILSKLTAGYQKWWVFSKCISGFKHGVILCSYLRFQGCTIFCSRNPFLNFGFGNSEGDPQK